MNTTFELRNVIMSQRTPTQTITTYRYRIIDVKSQQPLMSGDGAEGTLCVADLLNEFALFMQNTKNLTSNKRVLALSKTTSYY